MSRTSLQDLLVLPHPSSKDGLTTRIQQAHDLTTGNAHWMMAHLLHRTLTRDCDGSPEEVHTLWTLTCRVLRGEITTTSKFSETLAREYLNVYHRVEAPPRRVLGLNPPDMPIRRRRFAHIGLPSYRD